MEQEQLNEIINHNPNIDRTALDRSRQAAKQLEDVGIKLGGYRLMPALGGVIIKHSECLSGQRTSGNQQGSYSQTSTKF